MSKIFIFFLLLYSAILGAQEINEKTIKYMSLEDMTLGLSSKEIDDLAEIFEKQKIIDYERSNLPAVNKWLTELNVRLSKVIETQGNQYPFYKIYLMATPEVEAYIYKFRPAGQEFYRGHVFFSSGMIEQFVSSLGAKDIKDLNDVQFKKLLSGIQGVMAHEFSHPKEDELVKWDVRSAQGRSRSNHAQLDEMATDIMAMQTLRKADLDPEGMLHGLNLLEPEAGANGNLRNAIGAGISSHPEMELRLNMIRGFLSNNRMEQGFTKVKDIEFDPKGLREELDLVVQYNKVEHLVKSNMKAGDTLFKATLDASRVLVNRVLDDGDRVDSEFRRFLASLDLLGKFENENLTNQDVQEFIKWFEDFEKKYVLKLHPWDPFGGSEFYEHRHSPGGGGAGEKIGVSGVFGDVRMLQRKYRRMKVFDHPAVLEYFEKRIKEDLWTLIYKETEKVGAESLTSIMPQKIVNKIIREALNRLEEKSEVEQVQILTRLWVASFNGNSPQSLEVEVVEKLSQVMSKSVENAERFLAYSDNIVHPFRKSVVFNERLVRLSANDAMISTRLLQAYEDVFKQYLKFPLGKDFQTWYDLFASHGFLGRMFIWNKYANSKLMALSTVDASKKRVIYDQLLEALESEQWKVMIKDYFTKSGVQDTSEQLITLLRIAFGEGDIDKYQSVSRLLDYVVQTGGAEYSSKWLAKFGDLYEKTYARSVFVEYIYKKINQNENISIEEFLKSDFYKKVRGRDKREQLSVLRHFYQKKLISDELFSEELLKVSQFNASKYSDLFQVSEESSQVLWTKYRRQKIGGVDFLKKIQQASEISSLTAEEVESLGRDKIDEVKKSRLTKMKYAPDYARFLNHISDPIMSDFRVALAGRAGASNAEMKTLFKSKFELAYSFIKEIFNPDDISLSQQMRGLIKFDSYDKLAQSILEYIPDDLTFDQYFKVWTTMAAKRSNRHTDVIFTKYLADKILKKSDVTLLKQLLAQGVLKSEKIKISIMEKVFADDVKQLASSKGNVSDSELNKLIQKILTYSPDSSRFRDDYLEKLAWKFQLSEKQLKVFIEPLKSFNFKTVDQNMVNLMSVFSSLSQRMRQDERLSFVKFIQNPDGSIEKSIPRINEMLKEAAGRIPVKDSEQFYIRTRDNLESMIRDAGDNEKLILIESMVGTRQYGLWHNTLYKEELFKLAQLDGSKRALFESYLKALPVHEHSIVMSYLLATANNTGDTDILRIMEMFQTPGIKFAQMASIFGLFGEEESKRLAQAKNRAKPPTRAEIYEVLKERLSLSDYKKIKSVDRLLGSGGIKYVVSVTFEDGSKKAVYLRRPYIEESTETTLAIAEQWMTFLKNDPEFKNSMDYDYYLTSLRQQLAQEVQFTKEAQFTNIMADKYEKVDSYKGWKFKGVRSLADSANNPDLHYYALVENGVGFEDLTDDEKRIVSEYVVTTEVNQIFTEGDADRHMGNFLFDRENKIIYPLDMGQYYKLKSTSLFRTGQTYEVARMIYGLAHSDKTEGAKILVEVFEKLKTSEDLTDQARSALKTRIEEILKSGRTQIDQVLAVLSELNKSKLRLPFEISLGVIKGMSIVFNEEYAKVVGKEFVEEQVRKAVTREMVKAKPASILESIKGWFGLNESHTKKVKDGFIPADCNGYLRSRP